MDNEYSVSPGPEGREGRRNLCRGKKWLTKNAVEVKRIRFSSLESWVTSKEPFQLGAEGDSWAVGFRRWGSRMNAVHVV